MIEFKSVYKSFGNNHVLNGLDLVIPRGKVSFIIGKSGEGKSVTIKHIMGLLKPDSGQVLVEGQDLSKLGELEMRKHRMRIGMLFQHAALFDSMTVMENVRFPIDEKRTMSEEEVLTRALFVIEQVGLKGLEAKYPSQLSTGEKKRVGLARALAPEPKIILYDEPTTGMDPLISQMIDDLIIEVGETSKDLTSVVISHDLKAALATAQNVIMLYKGKVSLQGMPNDFRMSNDPVVRQFFAGRVEGPMEFL
jgi:phospholipid/cholesterol/gamma-HCH transport system ATP-binding protein